MEIQYYGGNCIKITTKKGSVVIDDNIKALGGTSPAKPTDVNVHTHKLEGKKPASMLFVDGPGEYEVSNISILGIPARSHLEETGKKSVAMYKVAVDDFRIAVVGHIYPELSESQLESFGVIDVLIVPVGGHGFTLDAVGAAKIIKNIDPKIIIPTNYADSKLNYPVPAANLEDVLKELALEPKETVPKLKLKAADLLLDKAQVIILERQ
ncbi:MAG: MBL fold metallo-hydrolase [Candidatus Saccharibacteria bacterium]